MPGKNTHIVVHCSDSRWASAGVIRQWHVERGWNDIGYHFVIGNGRPWSERAYFPGLDGSIEAGRNIARAGAHVTGFNSHSIGICLIGVDEFSYAQMASLVGLIRHLQATYSIPSGNVLGHCEKDPSRTCPNLDMEALRP